MTMENEQTGKNHLDVNCTSCKKHEDEFAAVNEKPNCQKCGEMVMHGGVCVCHNADHDLRLEKMGDGIAEALLRRLSTNYTQIEITHI